MDLKRQVIGLATAVAGLAGAAGVACRGQATVASPRPVLRIATAFSPLSSVLTAEYGRRLPTLDIRSQPATDSDAVIAGIEDGSVDLGVALADVAYLAHWGADGSRTATQDRIRGVTLLQPLPQYLLVRGQSGIRQVPDLRGRNVAVGPTGSSSSTLGLLVLDAFQITARTVVHLNTRAAAAAGLKDRSLDAVFLPGYVYPDEVMHAALRDGAYFVPIDGPVVDRLRLDHPFVRRTTIPREVYPGQDQIIPTVGIDMVVLCQRDLNPSVVYDLTAQLFSAYPRLSGVEATLRFLNPDEAPATPIPLHPGAARYFRERELSR